MQSGGVPNSSPQLPPEPERTGTAALETGSQDKDKYPLMFAMDDPFFDVDSLGLSIPVRSQTWALRCGDIVYEDKFYGTVTTPSGSHRLSVVISCTNVRMISYSLRRLIVVQTAHCHAHLLALSE